MKLNEVFNTLRNKTASVHAAIMRSTLMQMFKRYNQNETPKPDMSERVQQLLTMKFSKPRSRRRKPRTNRERMRKNATLQSLYSIPAHSNHLKQTLRLIRRATKLTLNEEV